MISIIDQRHNDNTTKPKVGVGLLTIDKKTKKSIHRATKYAEITIITPDAINLTNNNLKYVSSSNPEIDLISLLKNGSVEGILRGSLDAIKLNQEYEKCFHEKSIGVPALMKRKRHTFFLTLLSGFVGWDVDEKLNIVQTTARFIKKLNVIPKIAIFSSVRENSLKNINDIDDKIFQFHSNSINDAKYLTNKLSHLKYDVKNWEIELKQAVDNGSNILVPINGVVGNQIFRTLQVCGFKNQFSPRLGVSKYFAENDRNQKNLTEHIKNLSHCIRNKISFL